MSDHGHKLTNDELKKLERRINAVYRQTAEEEREFIYAYFDKLEDRDAEMKTQLENGKITEQQYTEWRKTQIMRGEGFEALQNRLAERMTNANEVAISYVNDTTPAIYSLNRNYAAYTIEQATNAVDFNLFDERTVRRLIVEDPDVMPYYPTKKAVKRGIDLAYGKKKISQIVTSGILRGVSIPTMANELQGQLTSMNRASAIRAARTATTGAQNGGRQDSYDAAAGMGIKFKKEWVATLDDRTRVSHADLDGQRVDPDKKFSNGLMFPGDTSGAPAEVYSCRCTMIAVFPETKETLDRRQTYDEWKDEKESANKLFTDENNNGIIKSNSASQYHTSSTDSAFKPVTDEQFNKYIAKAKKMGANVIRGGEYAEKRLVNGKRAVTFGDTIVFREGDISKTDIYEETRHVWQNINNMFAEIDDPDIVEILKEIEAKEYLIANAKKLRIPRLETEATKAELEDEFRKLKDKNGEKFYSKK